MSPTAACVDIYASDNVTLQDAFQFGLATDTSWSFTGQSFKFEAKSSREDVTPRMTLTSAGGSIVVDSAALRILHLNQPQAALQAALPCGEYVYDLVMFDASVPPIRSLLMHGRLFISRGVTED